MMMMRKVFIIILACLLIILIISFGKINMIKIDNLNIVKQIDNIESNNDAIDKEILATEEEINTIKEEKKDKWQELNVWLKTKEKLEAALSQ